MNIEYSIYIPRVSAGHTMESIQHIMNYIPLGGINRVDFIPINKKPGFGEHVDSVVKSAFVYFSHPNREVGSEGEKIWRKILSGESYKIQVYANEYWICLKNKNPIRSTMMNIHQVVENSRHLEGLLVSQQKIIQDQEERIKHFDRKIKNMDSVIQQLIGGLYCQETQRGIAELHRRILNRDDLSNKPLPEDTHKWNIWPTTRQGDESEKRIKELEDQLQGLIDDLDTYNVLRYS